MGFNALIEIAWRSLIVVICLATLSDKSPTFAESLFTSRVIAFSGIYWAYIPLIEEVKRIIKEKKLFRKKSSHKVRKVNKK